MQENHRSIRHEFAWVAEFDRKLADEFPPEEGLPRRVMLAEESVVVLDLLAEQFAGGKMWIQNCLKDLNGFCLVGGLREIRQPRSAPDRAGVYLSRAILRVRGIPMTLIAFNDSCYGYDEIREIISFGRESAQLVVDDFYGSHYLG